MRRFALACLIPLLLPVLSAGAQATKIQCWIDNKGVRVCGDHVPPEYAKKERQTFDSSGRVVDTKARQKTPEEVAAEQAAARAEAEARKRAAEQARYDKFLLDTYSRLGDLEKARDDRLITVGGQLKLAEQALVDSQAILKQLSERADLQRKNGREPDKKLQQQIKDFERGVADNLRAVDSLKAKQVQLTETYGRDIERYKQIASPAALAVPETQPAGD